MKRTRTFFIYIYGERWKYRLLPLKKYSEVHDDSLAMTVKEERTLDFSPEGVALGTCRHELFHAYCTYLFLEGTESIAADEYEEIFASMLDHNWDKMTAQADKMYAVLKEALEHGQKDIGKKVRRRKTADASPPPGTPPGDSEGAGVRSKEVRGLQLEEGNEVESPDISDLAASVLLAKG